MQNMRLSQRQNWEQRRKNKGLCAVADELIMQQELILAENQKDLKAAEEKGVKQSLIDRLALSEKMNCRYGGRTPADCLS